VVRDLKPNKCQTRVCVCQWVGNCTQPPELVDVNRSDRALQ